MTTNILKPCIPTNIHSNMTQCRSMMPNTLTEGSCRRLTALPVELCELIIEFKNDLDIHTELKIILDGVEWLRRNMFVNITLPVAEMNRNQYFVRKYIYIKKNIDEMKQFYMSGVIKTRNDIKVFNSKFEDISDDIATLSEHLKRMETNHRFYLKLLNIENMLCLHY